MIPHPGFRELAAGLPRGQRKGEERHMPGKRGIDRKKRPAGWIWLPAAVLSLAFFALLLVFVFGRPMTRGNSLRRDEAAKALALAVTDRDSLSESLEEDGNLVDHDGEAWSDKYVSFLLREGYLAAKKGGETGKVRDSWVRAKFTYGDAARAAEKAKSGLSSSLGVPESEYRKAMPAEVFWLFYDAFVSAVDPDGEVSRGEAVACGISSAVGAQEASSGEPAGDTSAGEGGKLLHTAAGDVYSAEGLDLSGITDRKVSIMRRGSELIRVPQVISDEVTYRNVWVSRSHGKISMVIGDLTRDLGKPEDTARDAAEKINSDGQIADISLDKGRITGVTLKTGSCEGRILSINGRVIEVEGYGQMTMEEDFRVYRIYGQVSEQNVQDMLVGYDLGRLVIEDGKACAALLTHSFSAKNIRVLITTDDFSNVFHDMAVFTSDGGFKVACGGAEKEYAPGEKFRIEEGDELFRKGRVTLTPLDGAKGITIASVNRAYGHPSCPGTIEVSEEESGLLIINDLDLEDYLERVVPSEMPAEAEEEALKAQAVCARTYAWRQIRANAYQRYGAHVDDSAKYQVYNNYGPESRTNQAVRDTRGLLLCYDGKPAETYYYSTSCGYGTDTTIWNDSAEDTPYLKSRRLSLGEDGDMPTPEEMTGEEVFRKVIQKKDPAGVDSAASMYRWTTEISASYAASRVIGIGDIVGFFVSKRAPGGAALSMEVVGTEGRKYLRGSDTIRKILGDAGLTYLCGDGTKVSGLSILPSPFIYIDETARDETTGERTFTIWGGGFGHGIGMSQSGARAMAKAGKDYRDILNFFYPGTELRTVDKAG